MADEQKTLGELLSDPRIRQVAPDAIKNMDLTQSPLWRKTLAELRAEHFGGEIGRGLDRLEAAAESGAWFFPLYSGAECAENPDRQGSHLVWFPSEDPKADGRPYILLVPGGGFVNVWNLTEGWPIAEQYNRLGYHVFILTYQVAGEDHLLEKDMEDFAQAIRLIRDRADTFHVQWDRYITCGFSAGGYLVCLWNTAMGYLGHEMAGPQAVFPVYAVTSLRERLRLGAPKPAASLRLYGLPLEEAAETAFEIPEHAAAFPPCALFLSAGDQMVNPIHSKLLAQALKRLNIPCRLEIGPEGGHGFGDGSGMCMAGWIERGIRWYESLA